MPEKKRGSFGVSMRKRRGLKSDVAVEPMMVRYSTSARLISGVVCGDEADVGHVEGCEVAASRWFGVWAPEPGLDGAREEMVVLSRVSRKEVMITCGTWYVLCRT